MLISTLLCFSVYYIAGSVNFSILGARLFGFDDPRKTGSGNAGATNLSRTAGRKAAAFVLVLDIARAFGLMQLQKHLLCEALWPAAALPLIAGNMFPVFHGFKGGKGVAMSVGILGSLSPLALLVSAICFVAVALLSRRISPASICFIVAATSTIGALTGFSSTTFATWSVVSFLVIAAHWRNIKRLFKGAEPPLW